MDRAAGAHVDAATEVLRAALGRDLVGLYLHGSATSTPGAAISTCWPCAPHRSRMRPVTPSQRRLAARALPCPAAGGLEFSLGGGDPDLPLDFAVIHAAGVVVLGAPAPVRCSGPRICSKRAAAEWAIAPGHTPLVARVLAHHIAATSPTGLDPAAVAAFIATVRAQLHAEADDASRSPG